MPNTGSEAERIAREHYADVLAYCRRHTASAHEAQDAAQETFLRFVRSQPSYRDRGRPLAYLLTIARNVCVDLSRKHVHDPAELSWEPPAPQEPDPDLELALQALPADAREALELRYGQGLRVGEVARVLGVSRFAAARRINAALNALKTQLDPTPARERSTS